VVPLTAVAVDAAGAGAVAVGLGVVEPRMLPRFSPRNHPPAQSAASDHATPRIRGAGRAAVEAGVTAVPTRCSPRADHGLTRTPAKTRAVTATAILRVLEAGVVRRRDLDREGCS